MAFQAKSLVAKNAGCRRTFANSDPERAGTDSFVGPAKPKGNIMINITKNSISITSSHKRPVVLFGAWSHEVRILKTEEELVEWERRMEAIVGTKVSAQAMMAGGGCCCGTSGGMCDSD
jgi:hypothetical protein